jgi:hypothetical protein
MDLSFGTTVREHGYSVGRLAGLEADRQGRSVHHIIISARGTTIDARAERRPLVTVPADHFGGDILLRAFPVPDEVVAPDEKLVLNGQTRVMREGRQIGRLSGLEVAPETGEIVAIVGRQHWWSRRFHLQASELDYSVPGEIRVRTAASRAA